MKVGFVGVGLMGHGIAKNIMGAGHQMSVLGHRNRAPVDDLVARGAREVTSLAELGGSDVVFLCLPGSPQIEATIAGLAPHLGEGAYVVDCSTADPVSTAKLHGELSVRGITLVDAPLGGIPVQAEAGELSLMIGADEGDFAHLKPLFESFAKTIVHVGGPGDGHKMKLLNNFLSLGYAALYSEALAVGRKVGISIDTFDSVIRGSRMDCGFYQTFMGYAVEGNRNSHQFTLTNALKDMRYLESMADAAGAANPIGNAAKNSYAMACANGGDGAEDYVPHLVDYVGRLNGIEG